MRIMLILFALLAGCVGQGAKPAPKDARPAAGCPK
jgi:hypothetical protein